jgi:VanZ family protein
MHQNQTGRAAKKVYAKRIIFFILMILWMVLIFRMSAQNADSSSSLSGSVLQKLLEICPALTRIGYDTLHTIIRKAAHFTEYGFLGLWVTGFLKTFSKFRERYLKVWGLTVILVFIYACTDELHQYFVAGRSCEFRDVLIDTSGAAVFSFLCIICMIINRKMGKKNLEK